MNKLLPIIAILIVGALIYCFAFVLPSEVTRLGLVVSPTPEVSHTTSPEVTRPTGTPVSSRVTAVQSLTLRSDHPETGKPLAPAIGWLESGAPVNVVETWSRTGNGCWVEVYSPAGLGWVNALYLSGNIICN